MDSATQNKTSIQPQTLVDLLPGLTGILSRESAQSILASAKKSRTTVIMPQTSDKKQNLKARTMAEMRADILALKAPSPKRYGQSASAMKSWNCSVKVDQKKISHTSGKNINKHASVRKVLNFQSKPKPQVLFNSEHNISSATPKFIKPQTQTKKTFLPMQGKNKVPRISGIYAIPQTPLESTTKAHPISRLISNKENIPSFTNGNRKSLAPPKILYNNLKKIHHPIVPETPSSNTSSDASFLQKEMEINNSELKNTSEMLENIAEISPPVSTPFKNYRSVHEYFMDNSNELDKSDSQIDNTIMVFDKAITSNENKKEESIIVSLCDLLNKARITTSDKPNNELTELLEMEKQTLDSIKCIETCITIMSKIKNTHEASLKNVQKLIAKASELNDNDRTLVMEEVELSVKTETATVNNEVTRNISVIKYTRSPSFTIPKKNGVMKKKLFHKSMPSQLNVQSPENTMATSNRAISMYLEMKEKMNFLNTPLAKRRPPNMIPDTPAVTSRNLQMQLDRLYNNS